MSMCKHIVPARGIWTSYQCPRGATAHSNYCKRHEAKYVKIAQKCAMKMERPTLLGRGIGVVTTPCPHNAVAGSRFCAEHKKIGNETPIKPKRVSKQKATYELHTGSVLPALSEQCHHMRCVAPDGAWVEVYWQDWDNTFRIRTNDPMTIAPGVSNSIELKVKKL